MYIEFLKVRVYPAAVVLTSMVSSVVSPVYADEKPREQDFVVTAYYSPLPDQSAYFRGNYEDEITFNGKGIAGADGTPVYPGMIAGPESYLFGTVIELPGIGVGTIHDRGGRIIEWGEDLHRIDIWMGYGEEGLTRAMAWGVRRVKGKVYPRDFNGAPMEHFALEQFNADPKILASLPKKENPVRVLQMTLKELGYFAEAPNGNFGPATQAALKKFQSEYGIAGDGSEVDATSHAALQAAANIKENNLPRLVVGLAEGMTGQDVRQAQKLLRYLGSYRGRTDGVFDQDFKNVVTAFQLKAGVIDQATAQGAGRIGPATHKAILKHWKVKVAMNNAKDIERKMTIAQDIQQDGLPKKTLSQGDKGNDVKILQAFLRDSGYLEADGVTGTFADRTKSALLKYQLDRQIIGSEQSKGAGVFGPATKVAVSRDLVVLRYEQVRTGK